MNGFPQYRRRFRRYPGYASVYPVAPVVVESASDGCACHSGSQLEQKIKENPLVFVLGALALGWLIARK